MTLKVQVRQKAKLIVEEIRGGWDYTQNDKKKRGEQNVRSQENYSQN